MCSSEFNILTGGLPKFGTTATSFSSSYEAGIGSLPTLFYRRAIRASCVGVGIALVPGPVEPPAREGTCGGGNIYADPPGTPNITACGVLFICSV